MKKQLTLMKTFAAVCMTLSATGYATAQFSETMGTTGASTETIAVREANNRFSVTALTYTGTADVRNTTPSTGYAGSTGGYNVLIQAQETFQVQSINASRCTTDSISFGVFKSTNASTGTDFLVLEYSVNSGAAWTSIPFTALPTGTGTSKWYRRSVLLPAAAHSATLWLRFRSTLVGTSSANPQFRIDDVAMTCGITADCSGLTASVATADANVFCVGGSADIDLTTNVASPSIQWYNQNGQVAGATSASITANGSGTYYAVVTNAEGCEVKTGSQYVLAYPLPAFCPVSVSSCTGSTVGVCATVDTRELIISEYVEGSNFNKYLELYNGTCSDIADMSIYQVRAYHNGASVPTYTIPLSGSLVAGDVYVIADSNAVIWTGTPNLLTDDLQFNGDDALVVFNTLTGQVADIFGSIGHDPGSAWRDADTLSATYGWRTENKTLVRKPCVYSGITVNPDLAGIGGFPTLVTEWDTLSVDDVSNLGFHDLFASTYTFTVASGNSAVASSSGSCAQITVGTGTSVIAVSATFCGFNDCAVPSEVVTVIDTCRTESRAMAAGSSSNGVKNAEVFPNPFTDNTTVVFEQENDGAAVITVATLSGQVMFAQTVSAAAGTQRVELNTSALAAGTYVCTISTDKGTKAVRIVKTK